MHGDAVSRPVHDSGVTILNILSIIKGIGWNGVCVCVCARTQWAYVYRCFSVSVQNIGCLPMSEVPGIVLLQGAVKILRRKIHLELRIPVFQRLQQFLTEDAIGICNFAMVWQCNFGSKVAVTGHVLEIINKCNFLRGGIKLCNFRDPPGRRILQNLRK